MYNYIRVERMFGIIFGRPNCISGCQSFSERKQIFQTSKNFPKKQNAKKYRKLQKFGILYFSKLNFGWKWRLVGWLRPGVGNPLIIVFVIFQKLMETKQKSRPIILICVGLIMKRWWDSLIQIFKWDTRMLDGECFFTVKWKPWILKSLFLFLTIFNISLVSVLKKTFFLI